MSGYVIKTSQVWFYAIDGRGHLLISLIYQVYLYGFFSIAQNQGKPHDLPKAYALTKAAASSDYAYAPAQLDLGFMHSKGIGTPKDYNEARKWFKAAKESADAELNWNDPEDTKVLKSVIRIAEIQIKILGL